MVESSVISEAQADFALKLLREVMSNNGGTGSTILSPTSVAIALSMVYAGATDETAKAMGKLLAQDAPESKLHEYFGELVESIQRTHANYTLEMANKVYIKNGFPILDAFKTTIDRHYGGLVEPVNFFEKAAMAQKINCFVKLATHDKMISQVIDADALNEDTRLILVNAIYFKGDWAAKFESHWTKKKPFYINASNEKQVDMMQHLNMEFVYSETTTFQMLGMPYAGHALCPHRLKTSWLKHQIAAFPSALLNPS